MFALHGASVSNAVIMAHASPSYDGYTAFKQGFISVAEDFEKPILYLQGDQHAWDLDDGYSGVANIQKVILERTGPGDPLMVDIIDDPNDPFSSNHNFDDSFL